MTLSSICVTCVMCALKVERLCAEGRKALLYALLVADVGEELAYVAEHGAFARGHREAEPSEVYADARCFERDGLAAGVRPSYDENTEFAARNLSPHLMSIGTDFAPSSGWRARTKENSVRFERSGIRHLSRRAVSESA